MVVQPALKYGKELIRGVSNAYRSYIHNNMYVEYCRLNQKYNMKGLVGGPLLVGGLGPGPPGPPLKSGPVLHYFAINNIHAEIYSAVV